MKFNSLLVLTGLLSTRSLANPNPDPQSPQQTEALASDLFSYISALITDSAFNSFASQLQTDPGLSRTVASFESSMSRLVTARITPTPGYLDPLPDSIKPLFSSIYSVEYRILEDNGFLTTTAATPGATGTNGGQVGSTVSSVGAAPTGGVSNKVKVAGALAAGFVGAVVAL